MERGHGNAGRLELLQFMPQRARTYSQALGREFSAASGDPQCREYQFTLALFQIVIQADLRGAAHSGGGAQAGNHAHARGAGADRRTRADARARARAHASAHAATAQPSDRNRNRAGARARTQRDDIQVAGVNEPTGGEPCGALYDVGQLARVAGPFVLEQFPLSITGQVQAHIATAGTRQHGAPRQGQNVAATLPQGGQPQRHHVETVVKVGAEATRAYLLGQIAIGGRDDTHIEIDGPGAPQSLDLALLQHAQNLRLQPQFHF